MVTMYYRDQINKVANVVKEIITPIKRYDQQDGEVSKVVVKPNAEVSKNLKLTIILGSSLVLLLLALWHFFIPKLLRFSEPIEKSIGVLPFVDMSPQKDQDWFCDGITDGVVKIKLTLV